MTSRVRVLITGAGTAPSAGDALVHQLGRLPARADLVPGIAEDRVLDVAASLDSAARHGDAVALISSALVAADEVLLRLLDDPRLGIGALVSSASRATEAQAAEPGTPVVADQVATQGSVVLAVGTGAHPVADADCSFLDAVYVAAAFVGTAARAVDALGDRATDLSELAMAMSRSPALPAMSAVRCEPFVAVLAATAAHAAEARAMIAADRDPQRAARIAARPGDGWYSTFVLRRISRHLTPWAVEHGISADAVTTASALIGVTGAACFAVGSYPALLAGAVLLQSSIVLDCVDGEIARATRTGSAYGAWLDAVTDRVKEYAALAGLAVAGHELWPVALAAMIVQTTRHLQDFSFDKGVLVSWRAGMRDTRPLTDTAPWVRPAGAGRGPELLTGTPSVWVRRLIRMPIGERWLILCAGAALNQPQVGLAGYLIGAVGAEGWSLVGAVRRTRGRVARYSTALRQTLADYRDDGPLRLGTPDGVAGWAGPPLTVLVEGATLLALTQLTAPGWTAAAFCWFAVVAWHRYDVAYRRGGEAPDVPPVVGALGGGWLVRTGVLGAAAAGGALPKVLVAGSCWLSAVYIPESIRAGLLSLRASGPVSDACGANNVNRPSRQARYESTTGPSEASGPEDDS